MPAVYCESLESLEFTEDRELTAEAAVAGAEDLTGEDAEAVPFPDEQAAIDRLKAAPTEVNRKALARVRAQYATTFWEQAQQEHDADALKFAFSYGESATQLDPDNGMYWSLLARICLECAENPLAQTYALDAAERAVRCAPNETGPRLFLADLQMGQRLFSSALDNLEAAARRDRSLVQPRTVGMLNVAYLADPQTERGIHFYREHLAQRPQDAAARIGLAILVQTQGDQKQAMQLLEEVTSSTGTPQDMHDYAERLHQEWQSDQGNDQSIGL